MVGARPQAMEAAGFIRSCVGLEPSVCLLTGTGLGDLADFAQIDNRIDYEAIPHFPVSTVESHPGRLLAGMLDNRPIFILQGRFHLYEGYSAVQVGFPIRVMQELGIQQLILTNAAGGINSDFKPGEIMLIRDHINLTGANPLVGPNEASWGERFPDMSQAYDAGLAQSAIEAAERNRAMLRQGVYAGLKGPSLETPAEIRFLRTIGADAVGFSTVQETITAVHARMSVLGLSIITNVQNPDRPEPVAVPEILAVAARTLPVLTEIIRTVIGGLG